jgi:glycine oxidase
MRAAVQAAQKCGVAIRSHAEVKAMRAHSGMVEVTTEAEAFTSGAAVNCLGAWAGTPVKPRKGQMLYLQPGRKDLLQHVVRAPEVYMVPRSSGKILVGATVEDVGFDTTVSSQAIQRLFTAAAGYMPELKTAAVAESWAGLRPGTPDDLPILGLTGTPGIFAATGHFRNGILLAPVTAKIMAELVAGKAPSLDITAFAASRFAPAWPFAPVP